MQLIRIASNAIVAKLYDAPHQAQLAVSRWLSYHVDGYEMSDAYQSGHWDGRSTFYDFKTSRFPAGFVSLVQHQLIGSGYTVQLVRQPLPAPRGPVAPKVDKFPDDPRYDYQQDTVNRLLRYGQMIAQVATGGGKSRIARLAYARIARPTLFLTTRSVLMYQMKRSFEESGFKTGIMGDGEWAPCSGFNVAMVQTLSSYLEEKSVKTEVERFSANLATSEQRQLESLTLSCKEQKRSLTDTQASLSRLRKELTQQRPEGDAVIADCEVRVKQHNARRAKIVRLLGLFEFVILEEAHEAGGDGYYNLLKYCKNAHYRLSLTATPFMRDGEESNMRLMACSGPVGIKVSEKTLIDRGILAKPFFKYVELDPPPKLYRSTPWQRAYKIGIVENDRRNEHVVFEAGRGAKHKLPVMILIQHKAHGAKLKELCREAGLAVEFIYGADDQEKRQAALTRLGNGLTQVLIGSTILDVGVDVPAVGLVILAGGGKAEVALRQRVGRGLRCKKGSNVALIVDFMDRHNKHLTAHAMQRREIIRSTEGFGENILSAGADFDFAALGL